MIAMLRLEDPFVSKVESPYVYSHEPPAPNSMKRGAYFALL